MFDVVITNDDLEKAYKELKDILNEVSKAISIFLASLANYICKCIPLSSFFPGNPKSSGSQIISLPAAGQKNQHL